MVELTDNIGLLSKSVPASELTDEGLVRAILEGSEAAFEVLFHRHRRRVARLAGRFCTQPERIEELVQEVFTKVFFALGDYSERAGNSFPAWLAKIAVNTCYDHLRYQKRRPEQNLGDWTDTENSEVSAVLNEALAAPSLESLVISQDLVRKLLARLQPEDQLVLTLLDAEELSVAEIAGVTGWSESKVKVRAFRARHALREVLADYL